MSLHDEDLVEEAPAVELEERTVEALARELLSIDVDEESGRAVPRRGVDPRPASTYNATKARLRWARGKLMHAPAFLAALDETRRTPI
jgi:hypothetical protein